MLAIYQNIRKIKAKLLLLLKSLRQSFYSCHRTRLKKKIIKKSLRLRVEIMWKIRFYLGWLFILAWRIIHFASHLAQLFYLLFLLFYLSRDVPSCLSVSVRISVLISSLSGSRWLTLGWSANFYFSYFRWLSRTGNTAVTIRSLINKSLKIFKTFHWEISTRTFSGFLFVNLCRASLQLPSSWRVKLGDYIFSVHCPTVA